METGLLEPAGEIVGNGRDPQEFTHGAALHLAELVGRLRGSAVTVGVRHNKTEYVAARLGDSTPRRPPLRNDLVEPSTALRHSGHRYHFVDAHCDDH
ncbi:hypothetical protein TPA0910_43810 [Streptomyces hygroscopicus subsp. sporocinereus]|uniref:Uncharacterized protein n=1 Tax=Streptomyces hygroscopicus TaxID=1912 RepID=A0ABQ3U436_STRHY|nr:hypothetical protein TPA0910_43810 [Streptomyces hygroscopicus]